METIENEINRLINEQEKIIEAKQAIIDKKKELKEKLDNKFKIGNIIRGGGIICGDYKLIMHHEIPSIAILVYENLSFDGMPLSGQRTFRLNYRGDTIKESSSDKIPYLNHAGSANLYIYPLSYIDEVKTLSLKDAFLEIKENHMTLYERYFEKDIQTSIQYASNDVKVYKEKFENAQKRYNELIDFYENKKERIVEAKVKYEDNVQVEAEKHINGPHFKCDAYHCYLEDDGSVKKDARYVYEFGFDEKK